MHEQLAAKRGRVVQRHEARLGRSRSDEECRELLVVEVRQRRLTGHADRAQQPSEALHTGAGALGEALNDDIIGVGVTLHHEHRHRLRLLLLVDHVQMSAEARR
jgi:hypothetical protein